MRVLIVEDEVRLAQALAQIMKTEHYAADMVHDGADGLAYALDGEYDVVVLDVMLPGMSGYEVVRQMRRAKNATPVLMLTARDEIPDKVQGLDEGADDYMTKPFSPEELLARVRALTRRQGEVLTQEMTFGDLTLNLSTNTLHCAGKSVRLGLKEFEVLCILMRNKNVITSKEELISRVWGWDSEAQDNNVEAYISFLRRKFTFLGSHTTISTVRKVGYRLEAREP